MKMLITGNRFNTDRMNWFTSDKKLRTIIGEYPEIKANERSKKIEISGFSRMSDPEHYYAALTGKLKGYFFSFNKTLLLDFHLEFISSSSIKLILTMITELQNTAKNIGVIEANWYYEEDDEIIRDTGEIFSTLLKIPFHLVIIA